MDRRAFLKSTGVATVGLTSGAALSGVALAGPSLAGKHIAPQAHAVAISDQSEAAGNAAPTARRIAEALDAATGGAIQLVEAEAPGVAAMQLAPAADFVTLHPALSPLFDAAPGMTATQHDAWLTGGGGDAFLDMIGEEAGVKLWLAGRLAVAPCLEVAQPVDGTSDLDGLAIAGLDTLPGFVRTALLELGATPVEARQTVPARITVSAMQFEPQYPALTTRYRLPGSRMRPLLALMMPRAVWDAFEFEGRAIVEAAIRLEHYRTSIENRTLAHMVRANGPEHMQNRTRRLPSDLAATVRARGRAAYETIGAGGDMASRIVASQLGFLDLTKRRRGARTGRGNGGNVPLA